MIVGSFFTPREIMILANFFRPIIDVRKGEWSKSLLAFFYFFLSITAYYVLKPARNSLYIEYIGVDNIPYAVIVIAFITLPIISIYAHYSKKIENDKLVSLFLIACVGCLFLFRWAFTFESIFIARIVSFVFYVWLTLFSSITVMQFWSLSNDIFDSQSAKRLYGFVGCGGIIGGMTGSSIAKYATTLGTENLLLVSALYIVLMLLVFNFIWYREKERITSLKIKTDGSLPEKVSKKESFTIVKKSRYLILILLIIALMKIVTVQTEWQYNKFVSIQFSEKDIRTSFFGSIDYYLNVASLIVQLIFTSQILKRYGANIALIPLHLGLCIGSLAVLIFPGIQAAAILKISEGSLRYSINQTATNFLYLPILRTVRYKIRPFIDVVGYQLAKGFGGVLTILYLFLMKNVFMGTDLHQATFISYVNLALLVMWFYVIYSLKKEYPNQIRLFLSSVESKQTDQTEKARIDLNDLRDAAYKQSLDFVQSSFFESQGRTMYVRTAVCLALYEGYSDQDDLKKLISEIMKAEGGGMQMSFPDSQDMVDEVLESLCRKKDPNERYDAIKMLNKIRSTKNDIGFDHELVFKQIQNEVDDYYKSLLLFVLYDSLGKDSDDQSQDQDFLYLSLKNILHESIERIFRLLALVYSPVDMLMIYQSHYNDNIYVRANGLELLDTILHPALFKIIFPILDGELSFTAPDSAVNFTTKLTVNRVDTLKKSLSSQDRWVILCSMVIIAKFKFSELYSDVRALADSKDVLIRHAAIFLIPRFCKKE
jgi:ATP/ADP translocase